ncbi:sensor histidine kinase [Nocardiopsis valliformis]|uniref:sensor histidine kinase n=1 Tax=Nocardiopsis valliformis TaxID=239974 RepID=UPI000344E18A|nr:nitrate- and nitrite sensing domain-containing protein [Nocardiopsis valliformis]
MGQSGGTGRGAKTGIRTQLNRIVLIPSITFLVLFVVLSSATLAQAISLRSSVTDGRAGVDLAEALTALQTERRLSAEYLTAPGGQTRQRLVGAAETTDEALIRVRDVRDTLEDDGDSPDPLTQGFFDSLDEVQALRTDDLADPGPVTDALDAYTAAIHHGIRLYANTVRGLDDGPASDAASAADNLLWAQESFGHADALVTTVLAERDLSRAEQAEIASLTGDTRRRLDAMVPATDSVTDSVEDAAEDTAEATAEPVASREQVPTVDQVTAGAAWADAMEMADTLVQHEARIDTDPLTGELTRDTAPPDGLGGWRAAADQVNIGLAAVTAERVDTVVSATEEASSWMFTLALGGGITSMFAGTVAYGTAARSAGRLTYRLAKLKAETLGIARSDLPRIVRRLEAGERVDLDTEMKQLDHGADEVGQVADAFNTAQRTAVGAAVKQADIRAGVGRVFLGIAHRNQSLVQRQLQLLDRMEREEEDPDLLESLFQLDHLATRGRRHAENLIILGGAQPGRRWRHPVPLVDILRGAISETDEYARVELTSAPDLSLVGAVVADVIHLLAELVENATAYSPPHTDVTIATDNVPKGVVIEIEDRGLGMTEEVLTDNNEKLAKAPEFDIMTPGTDGRLGIFVVARLARKHEISVQLRHSPYGGTRAVVLVPSALVVSAGAAMTERPRAAVLARSSAARLDHSGTSGHGDRENREDPADLLSAEAGSRPARPVLRSVPEHGERVPEAAPREHAQGAPLLRQVPDLEPEPRERVQGEAPAPLPRRGADSAPADGTRVGGVRGDGTRVGAGPDRAGLPRRRRQASLAPQLRDEPAYGAPAHEPEPVPQRSPEQARRMMDAFSAGTRRGRAEELGREGPEHSSDDQVGAGADDHTGESD